MSTSSTSIYLLSQNVNVSPQIADNTARQFTGIANSGQPFNYYGQRAIVDLSTLDYQDKVPILLLHDRDKRVGFGQLSVKNNQLLINGTLLENEHAKSIAQDADGGFPWQLSAHISAGSSEQLTDGQTAIINGQTLTAPILILKHCKIPEVSFTPTGIDNQTIAMILSDDPNSQSNPQSKGEPMTEIQQLKAELEKLKADNAKKDEIIQQLQAKQQQIEAEAKKTAVEAELSQHGFRKNNQGEWQGISPTTVDVLLSTDLNHAKAMIADLAQHKPNIPDFLLSEQHPTGQTPPTQQGNVLVDNAKARSQAKQGFL